MDPADGVTIEPVTTASVQLWDSVVAAGFFKFDPLPANTFAPFATVPQSLNFLARVDGVPAGGGTASIMPQAGIAALFGSATIPELRGRGVQTALINRRLWEAAQAGAEYAVVSTLPGSGSQRNMERRGFRVAYTKIVMVRTWPESANSGAEHGH
jgi:GNAT superfamily N-acetyltransferase